MPSFIEGSATRVCAIRANRNLGLRNQKGALKPLIALYHLLSRLRVLSRRRLLREKQTEECSMAGYWVHRLLTPISGGKRPCFGIA
jgi:hypothetical protein